MLDQFIVAGFGEGEFTVYQLLDCEGTPIYIGQTNNLERRLIEHSKDKTWFHEVKSVWFERLCSRQDRVLLIGDRYGWRRGTYSIERKRIEQFTPRYNQKPGREPRFTEPMTTMGMMLPAGDHSLLRSLAQHRGVSAQDLVREAVSIWLQFVPQSEIAAALAAPEREAVAS